MILNEKIKAIHFIVERSCNLFQQIALFLTIVCPVLLNNLKHMQSNSIIKIFQEENFKELSLFDMRSDGHSQNIAHF